MRHIILALSLPFLITGCATTAVIVDLEDDKVIVQGSGGDMVVINSEARKGCAMHDR